MQSLLCGVEQLDAASRDSIRGALPGRLISEVKEATPVGWIGIADNVLLADTIASCLGAARARPFFRQVLLLEYQSSLLKPFVEGIARVLGLTPTTFVKMAPRGWELVYRDCGSLEGRPVSETEACLVISDLPAACVRNELWLEAVRSTFFTAFDLSQVEGEIEWQELDLTARRASMQFRWRPRPTPSAHSQV
jgi:hypothetical protein